jgi:hypothetical protein
MHIDVNTRAEQSKHEERYHTLVKLAVK